MTRRVAIAVTGRTGRARLGEAPICGELLARRLRQQRSPSAQWRIAFPAFCWASDRAIRASPGGCRSRRRRENRPRRRGPPAAPPRSTRRPRTSTPLSSPGGRRAAPRCEARENDRPPSNLTWLRSLPVLSPQRQTYVFVLLQKRHGFHAMPSLRGALATKQPRGRVMRPLGCFAALAMTDMFRARSPILPPQGEKRWPALC